LDGAALEALPLNLRVPKRAHVIDHAWPLRFIAWNVTSRTCKISSAKCATWPPAVRQQFIEPVARMRVGQRGIELNGMSKAQKAMRLLSTATGPSSRQRLNGAKGDRLE
jgi:hypothetical protein